MKILFITTISSTFNAFLIPHAKLLKKLGHQVYLASNKVGELEIEALSSPSNFFNVPLSRNTLSPRNFQSIKILRSIDKVHNFDLVYTHTPNASFYARLAFIFRKIKVLYFVHGYHFHKNSSFLPWMLYFPIEYIFSYFTTYAITINNEDYNIALKWFHYKKVFRLNGVGIDLKRFTKVNNYHLNTICSIGELNKNKNHLSVIKSFIKFPELRKIHYFIAGNGPLKNRYKKLIIKHNLKNIHLEGYQKNIDLFLNQCSILIHPSKREGLPIAPLEAMAKGIPVIASNIRGPNEYINNLTGIYISKNNPEESIQKSIEELLLNNNYYNYLSLNSVIKSNEFSLDSVLNELEKIFDYIVSTKKRT